MSIKVGHKVPDTVIKIISDKNELKTVNFFEYCQGKKVVVFGLPGAFTPVCSSQQLPGYLKYRDEFCKKGIDEIICLSVNDTYVMQAWAQAHHSLGKIEMLADGNADLTKALGMEEDLTHSGMGIRSQRYAMVIENGIITNIEIEEKGTECKLSSAPSILEKL